MDTADSESSNRGSQDFARSLTVNAARAGRFTALATKIHRIADSQLAQRMTEPVGCKAGCARCHRLVGATLPEAVAIAELVAESFSPSEIMALASRTQEYQDAIDAHFRGEVEKFRAPCPFLVDSLCTV